MFFSRTKAEWREVEGRMMVTTVTIMTPLTHTDLVVEQKWYTAQVRRENQETKFVKLQLVLIHTCGSILVSSSREGVKRTLCNGRFGDGHLKRQPNVQITHARPLFSEVNN